MPWKMYVVESLDLITDGDKVWRSGECVTDRLGVMYLQLMVMALLIMLLLVP